MVTAGSGKNNWMEFRRILRIQFRRRVYTPLLKKSYNHNHSQRKESSYWHISYSLEDDGRYDLEFRQKINIKHRESLAQAPLGVGFLAP